MPTRQPYLPLFILSIAAASTGCSTFWPAIVRSDPKEPLFHASSMAGDSSTDGAVCSLSTFGPDVVRMVSPPESTSVAIPLENACAQQIPATRAQRGRVGQLVSITTTTGPVFGYLYNAPSATGVVVAFSGLGMPAGSWINERFAEVAALKGLLTFAPVRDEAARPIYFDPLREARRAIEAARQVVQSCHVATPGDIRFLGLSLGGLEALLAAREALQQGMSTHAVVLDPLLDAHLATDNLDSYWHSLAVDTMQAFFRRILSGRYGEWPTPSFRDVMARTRSHSDAMTDLDKDVPSAWLCGARREAYSIFLSEKDPVLGEKQRDFAASCGFPTLPARVPGHVPLACRLELFDEMTEALRSQVVATDLTPPRHQPP